MKSFKSPLERQVAEAVRIQLRGSTLNSMGVYNRCKLTRLVVDTEWDKKVFNENWKKKDIEEVEFECDQLEDEGKSSISALRSEGMKRTAKGQGQGPEGKKRRVNMGPQFAWGEELLKSEPERIEFLASGAVLAAKETTLKQLKIAPVPMSMAVVGGIMRNIIMEVVKCGRLRATPDELLEWSNAVAEDGVWEIEVSSDPEPMNIDEKMPSKSDLKKIKKEEEFLSKMLKNLDILSRKEESKKEKEKAARIKAAAKVVKEREESKYLITSFFKPKRALAVEVEMIMSMEVDAYDWKTLDRIQESWARASRLRRAAVQRREVVQREQEKK